MRIAHALPVTVLAAVLAPACGGGELPPLTTATSLTCPTPGDLPFRLMSTGYQNPTSRNLSTEDPRFKDEASDTLGNPGGLDANVYLADAASPTAGDLDYHGRKAVTTDANGFTGNALPGEFVSLWTYDPAAAAWMMLDRTQTDADGVYDFPATGYVAANGQPVYAMLEANGSCADHFTYLLPAGTKVVVVDIDGTLTLSDNELQIQSGDVTYVPKLMGAADKLTQAWAAKKYQVVYLTARPHTFLTETRTWLEGQGFPPGPVITENDFEMPAPYKTLWLTRMIQSFGWQIEAAYGNADTDIQAYAAVNIPLDVTFIVGPEGGVGGTVAIPNLDFTDHIASFVTAQPDNP